MRDSEYNLVMLLLCILKVTYYKINVPIKRSTTPLFNVVKKDLKVFSSQIFFMYVATITVVAIAYFCW